MGSSATVAVSTIGQTHLNVSYFSADNAGNRETVRSVAVTVVGETIPPTTTATGLQAANNVGWTTTRQQVALTATDRLGRLRRARRPTSPSTARSPRTAGRSPSPATAAHAVTYWSEDNAGNEEAHHTGYVNIDTQAPTTTVPNYNGAWTNRPVTLQFSADDQGGSGVASTQYSTNGGKKWVTGTSYTVSSSGQTTNSYRSTDKLGNVETTKKVVVRIDTAAPSIKISTPKNKGTYRLGTLVLASWTVSDSQSGVASASGTVASGAASTPPRWAPRHSP